MAFWPIGPLGQARRDHLHPPQLRRRRDLQARRARVPRPPARQALQPRVVHRGRPHPHRQAAPAEVRPAALPGRRRRQLAGRPGRRRDARAGLDRLRPAARGRRDGRRAGRRRRRRPRGSAGSPATSATSGAASASARVRFGEPISLRDALAEAGRGPARSWRRSRSGSASASTARRPVTPDLAGDVRAARRARPRADARPGARVVAPLLRLLDDARDDRRPRRPAQATPAWSDARPARGRRASSSASTAGREPVWSIGADRHHVAAFYRNGALHHLLNRAMLETRCCAVVDDDRERAADEVARGRLGGGAARCATCSSSSSSSAASATSATSCSPSSSASLRAGARRRRPGRRRRASCCSRAADAGRARDPAARSSTRSSSSPTVLADRSDEAPSTTATSSSTPASGLGQQWCAPGLLHGADVVSRELFSGGAAARRTTAALLEPRTPTPARAARRGATRSPTCATGCGAPRPGARRCWRRCSMTTASSSAELDALDARRAAIARRPGGRASRSSTRRHCSTAPPRPRYAREALRAGRTAWRALPGDVALVAGAPGTTRRAVRRLVAALGRQGRGRARPSSAASCSRDEIAARLHPEMWALVAAHQRAGHRVVLAGRRRRASRSSRWPTSSTPTTSCATEVEVRDGVAHRRARRARAAGARGKAAAVRGARSARRLAPSFAYANGAEDVAFLGAGGQPAGVAPTTGCARRPTRRGWPVLRCAPRRARSRSVDVARTAAFYGALSAAVGAGLGGRAARRSRAPDGRPDLRRRRGPRARAGRHRRRGHRRRAPVVVAARACSSSTTSPRSTSPC